MPGLPFGAPPRPEQVGVGGSVRRQDLLWLLALIAAVAVAVAWTPYDIPMPRPRNPVTGTPVVLGPAPVSTPDSFSFNCSGNRHGKAYTGFQANWGNYPQYDAEQGLLDHP